MIPALIPYSQDFDVGFRDSVDEGEGCFDDLKLPNVMMVFQPHSDVWVFLQYLFGLEIIF